MSQTFRAPIVSTGKTAAGIRVPDAIVEALGGGRRPLCMVTLNGTYRYRCQVAPMGGEWWLGVSNEHRASAGLAAGDEVEVELVVDTSPRELEVPPELAAALDADAVARAFFDGLSYSNRRVFTLSVEGTSNPETKAKRVAKALALMHEGRVR